MIILLRQLIIVAVEEKQMPPVLFGRENRLTI
jgi:hypothetical protein